MQQIALAGTATELAKAKYQVTQGEFVSLSAVQKQSMLRNASLLDQINSSEKLKALSEELLSPEEALLKKTKERIELLKQAMPVSEQYRDVMERISKASVQKPPEFSGVDVSVSGAMGEMVKSAKAEKRLEEWNKRQLEMQKELLDEKLINEELYAKRVEKINETYTSKLNDIQQSYKVSAIAAFGDISGSAADMARTIYGESSGAYRTLFLAQKAFAVASIIMNAQIAAAKAPAELTVLGGIPVGAALLAAGYANAAMVGGMALAGMAHDGIDRVPETGTWLLQKGERVVTSKTSAKLDDTLEKVQKARQGMGGGHVEIHNSFTGKPDDATMAALDQRDKKLIRDIRREMAGQVMRPTNDFGRALHGYYKRGRKE